MVSIKLNNNKFILIQSIKTQQLRDQLYFRFANFIFEFEGSLNLHFCYNGTTYIAGISERSSASRDTHISPYMSKRQPLCLLLTKNLQSKSCQEVKLGHNETPNLVLVMVLNFGSKCVI